MALVNNNIKILDCTLRDGGYYNNWDFSRDLIQEYLQAMAALRVDYVEIGFRGLINKGYKGGCAFSTDNFINSFSIPVELKNSIGVMINGAELLPSPSEQRAELPLDVIEKQIYSSLGALFTHTKKSPVTLVRIACHVHEFEYCLLAANWLKEQGYLVGFNLMQVASSTEAEISRLAYTAEKFPIDVLYFADSMGSLNAYQTSKIISALKKSWKGELGIHTHDNIGNALGNSIQAVSDGVTWVDGTVLGMGRGAGNVKTEYLVIALEEIRNVKPKITKLLEVIDKYFKLLQNQYGWGSNPYYYFAGIYGIHPSFIQEMLADSRYNIEEILIVLERLRTEGGKKFSLGALEMARNFYSGEPYGDWKPIEAIDGKEVLILGSGPGVLSHRKVIEAYINKYKPYVISLNTQKSICEDLINIRSACHPVRLLADYQEYQRLPQPLVAPIGMLSEDIQKELESKQVYNYGITIQSGVFAFHDTHCILPSPLVIAYSLAIATSGKAKKILLSGFDGYGADDPRRKEMDQIFNLYMNADNSVPIISVTPTRYEIPEVSIYAFENEL